MNSHVSKILIVEDDEIDAEYVQRCLQPGLPAGYEVCTADSLQSALEHILVEPRISLIVADLNLPDSRDLETFQSLKDRAGAIPIIILSGTDNTDAAASAIRRGAHDYLVKGQADERTLKRILRLAIERVQRLQRPPLAALQQFVGQNVGAEEQYEIKALARVGTLSLVFRGWHRTLHREVALKTPHPDVCDVIASDVVDEYLQVEARMQHHLVDCPRIVTIFDSFTHNTDAGPCHFIVAEWIQGRNARELLNCTMELLPPVAVCEIMRQTSDAVSFAHQRGVIHRDVKPANLLLATEWDPYAVDDHLLATVLLESPDVRLTDFGLARVNRDICRISGADTLLKKVAGRISGTPDYLPPEVAAGGEPNELSDIYSLGATLYELLTGHVPFRGDEVDEVLRRHKYGNRPKPSARCTFPNRRSREMADTIVSQAMAVEPENRYQTVCQFRDAVGDLERSLTRSFFGFRF